HMGPSTTPNPGSLSSRGGSDCSSAAWSMRYPAGCSGRLCAAPRTQLRTVGVTARTQRAVLGSGAGERILGGTAGSKTSMLLRASADHVGHGQREPGLRRAELRRELCPMRRVPDESQVPFARPLGAVAGLLAQEPRASAAEVHTRDRGPGTATDAVGA